MELSIGQVAKRTGLSARMLRHYDALGLYRPSRVSENGYRWYSTTTLPRLYRILALRRAGVGLHDIGRIVDEQSDEAEALREHLHTLRAEQGYLAELIASIESQVEQLGSAQVEDPDALRATYRTELAALTRRLRAKYPASFVESYLAYAQTIESMSIAEIEHLVATAAMLMTKLAALAAEDAPIDSSAARRGIGEHYAMLTQTVPLSPAAYRSLGRAYVEDPLQHSLVAAFHPDLPAWLSRAIRGFRGDASAGRPTRTVIAHRLLAPQGARTRPN